MIFILVFTPAWHAWADAKENANNYYNDDLLQRAAILWIMSLLILYGNNANYVGEDLWAQRATVGAYMCIRFTQIFFFFLYSIASHHHRTQNRIYAGMTFIGMFIWIPIYFEEVSDKSKIAVAAVAIFWEELSYVVGFTPLVAKKLKLEYTTAVDIGHENDRYTAFTIIVLGEFTYVIVVGYVQSQFHREHGSVLIDIRSPAKGGLNLELLRAVCTLVIGFCFNSMYVYTDGCINNTHPIRRSVYTAFPWLLIHLPMSAGLLIGGHVSAASTFEEELSSGKRWLWGGGLGLGMFCMWVIAQLYREDDGPDHLKLRKVRVVHPQSLACADSFSSNFASCHDCSFQSSMSCYLSLLRNTCAQLPLYRLVQG